MVATCPAPLHLTAIVGVKGEKPIKKGHLTLNLLITGLYIHNDLPIFLNGQQFPSTQYRPK